MKSNRIAVITGAHGFIGRNVSKYLSEHGCYVVGIGQGDWSRSEYKDWGLNVWVQGIISEDLLVSCINDVPDYIIHCAGSGSVGYSYIEPEKDFKSNVLTLLSILEYIRKHSPLTRLVYPSSAAVYGNSVRLPISEDDIISPISPYGYHKKIAEDLCRSYGSTYGIKTSIIRLFSVYGPGLKKQLLFDCCEKARNDNPYFFGTGNESRDFIHVSDASGLIVRAVKKASPDIPVFNGGSGESIKVKDLVNMVFSYMGYEKEAVFNNEHREGDPIHYLADNKRAGQIGWSALVDLNNGIKEYVDWYKDGCL